MIWITVICTVVTVTLLGALINAWRIHLNKNVELH